MAPSKKDFDYNGLKISHVNGWNANDYNNRVGEFTPTPSPTPTTPKPLPKNPPVTPPEPLDANEKRDGKANQTTLYDHQLHQAKMKDWRNRGLTNK